MKFKVDLYTKFILTVIAICLCWLSINNFVETPNAVASNHDLNQVYIKGIVVGGEEKTFDNDIYGIPVCVMTSDSFVNLPKCW